MSNILGQKKWPKISVLVVYTIMITILLGAVTIQSGEFSKIKNDIGTSSANKIPSVEGVSTTGLSPLESSSPIPAFEVTDYASATPIPTTKPKVQAESSNNQVFINCTGPDGKTIQLTQEDCNKFNESWNKAGTTSPNQTSLPANSNNSTKSPTSNDLYMVGMICLTNNTTAEQICSGKCTDQAQQAYSACSSEFPAGSDGETSCTNQATSALQQCNQGCLDTQQAANQSCP